MKTAPPLSTGEARVPDELDALLQGYFRAEMPDPWPSPPLVRPTQRQVALPLVRQRVRRSRLVLAASAALLLAGTLVIPHQSAKQLAPTALPTMFPGEATRVPLPESLSRPKEKSVEWRGKVTEEAAPRK